MSDTPTARQLALRVWVLVKRSFRFWPVFAGALVIAVAAAFLVPRVVPPMYSSQTVLMYRELIAAQSLVGNDAPVEQERQRGARLREMLMSRTNAQEIIEELDLYPTTVQTLGMVDAVEEFRSRAKVDVGMDTFTITFEHADPEVTFAVTEKLAQSLIEQTAKYRSERALSTKDFMEAQLTRTKAELDQREYKLAEFLSLHPEFAQDDQAQSAGASIRARERNTEKLRSAGDPVVDSLERQKARLMAQLEAAENPGAVIPEPSGPSVPPHIAEAVRRAQQQYDRAKSNLDSARSKYTDAHPDVVAAKGEFNAAKSQLDAAKTSAAEATAAQGKSPAITVPTGKVDKDKLQADLKKVEENLAVARKQRKDGIQNAVAAQSSNLIVQLETEWAALNRELQLIRDRYQQVQRRYFQASIVAKVESSGDAAQMTIIDPPYKPERPDRRGSRRTGAVAAMVVMILGGLIAFALAYLDDRVYEETDIEQVKLGGLCHTIPLAKRRS